MAQVAHVQLVHAPGEGGDKLRTRSWIEIQLVGEDGSPIDGVAYEIELPGGKLLAGTLDERGTARVDAVPSGVCKVSFPELDKDAWTPLAAPAGLSPAHA
jgi:hypothetical protein